MAPIPISTFDAIKNDMLTMLRTFVEIESPTYEKNAVDRLGDTIKEKADSMDARIECIPQTSRGDHWVFQWGKGDGGILLMTHMDTVHPVGTLKDMPVYEEKGIFYGPGVMDMKGGIVVALTAIEVLQKEGQFPNRRITLICTSDEETGSATSRSLIEKLAKEHDLVLCLEPALADGSLKTWRKGIGRFTIEVLGRSAHAGSEPEAGINAIVEMSYQIQKIAKISDHERGTTLNVGKIQGGTRTNVVPEKCVAIVDVRAVEVDEQERVTTALLALDSQMEGATLHVEGSWNRPPMPRTSQIAETFSKAQNIAAQIGLSLTESGTGGGSDANFVAALGIPVLDGLGVVGGGAHSPREYLEISSLPERAALLAALLTEW
jgi:glutamate carboxypeptidase